MKGVYDSWKGFKITTQQRFSAAWFTRIAHEQCTKFLQFLLACNRHQLLLICKQVFHKYVDSLSSQQLVPNYFLYPSKGSDVYFGPIFTKFINTPQRLAAIWQSLRPVWSVGKMDCQELLEVHRNVIDMKSIAFLVILLAPEDSFVTLHMRWYNRMLF